MGYVLIAIMILGLWHLKKGVKRKRSMESLIDSIPGGDMDNATLLAKLREKGL